MKTKVDQTFNSVHAWFLSDIHLKSTNERNSEILLRFLHSFNDGKRPITHLFLLGDIFDIWVGGHSIFIQKWKAHLDCIQKLIQNKNVQVVFVEGNHDLHISPYWEKKLKAKVYTEEVQMTLGLWRIHLEHGDLINKNDLKYLKYRSLIRSWPLKMLGYFLPGIFWDRLGQWMSQKSSHYSRQFRADHIEQMKNLIREHAQTLSDVDFVLSGHFHVQDEFEFNKGNFKVKSVNLGTWLNDSDLKSVYHIDENGGSFEQIS